jgi:activator of HSP90 ATPase
MLETIQCSIILPVEAGQLYHAWLDSDAHSRFTGSPAQIDPRVGGHFTAWDGYIEGTTLEMEPYRRILQSWRASEFPTGSADSRLEILLEDAGAGQTRITLLHSEIPAGQGQSYLQGWEEFYFQPMQEYFVNPD